MKPLPKIIVIVGPTGSGKTDLGVFLAKKFGGEVVNADSRQVYRGMDIGTGKPSFKKHQYVLEGIRHHLFDFAWPAKTITVSTWKQKAERVIRDIVKRGKTPIVVGGTGLYIQALVENLKIPSVPPNPKLRKEFEKKSSEELLELLARLDPDAAVSLDPRNPRRIIRALEVSIWTGKPFSKQQMKGKKKFDALQIGIAVPRKTLYTHIDKRIDGQMKDGWLEEVTRLKKRYRKDISAMSGIGYRELVDFLEAGEGEEDLKEVIQKIKYRTHNYARRQLIWLRRDKTIRWIKTKSVAECLVKEFLKK
jgi:tRNA dimethylallyltransferase